jgi:hypothetical protein
MAKQNGVRDLSALAMSDEQAAEAQEMLEEQLGARCQGCGRRITMGMQFTSIDVRHEKPVQRLAACMREDCDFAEQCRDGATFVEMIEFAWADPAGADARPAPAIVKRANRRAMLLEQQKAAQPES